MRRQSPRLSESTFVFVLAALAVLVLPAVSGAAEGHGVAQWTRSSGNMALLVVTDSSAREQQLVLDRTLFAALDHFGMPFQVLDLAAEPLTTEVLQNHSALVLAQSGLGHRLSEEHVAAIKEAVEKGVGLVNFDGMLSDYPAVYQRMLGVPSPAAAHTASVTVACHTHPITRACAADQKHQLLRPVAFTALDRIPRGDILLQTEQGLPAAFAVTVGKGRVVQFTLSPEFWLPEYFGHVQGLDGVFWRSVAWVARKPFVMVAMPPLVTARIDDASGSGSRYLVNKDSAAASFRYIDALNKFRYIPNVGLFTDDIPPEDGKILKQKFDGGLAEFSAHAWTNERHIYNERVLNKPGASPVEFSAAELQQAFAKLDRQFDTWGIKPSRTVNSHFFNPGINSLPFLKQRGETFLMFAGRFGRGYSDPTAYAWNPKPYGHPGFTCDYMPDDPEFFNVEAHPYVVASDGRISDGDKITEANHDPASGRVRVKVTGKATLPLSLYVFAAEGLEYQFQQIPAFQGEQTVDVVK